MSNVQGSCLCGAVIFECQDQFFQFHLCHCHQCQKASGSAHASNLFTHPQNIEWISGQRQIKRFDVPGRVISSAFCSECGSPVPYTSLSGQALVVPAGSLDCLPDCQVNANIFWHERASWYEHGVQSPHRDKFVDS